MNFQKSSEICSGNLEEERTRSFLDQVVPYDQEKHRELEKQLNWRILNPLNEESMSMVWNDPHRDNPDSYSELTMDEGMILEFKTDDEWLNETFELDGVLGYDFIAVVRLFDPEVGPILVYLLEDIEDKVHMFPFRPMHNGRSSRINGDPVFFKYADVIKQASWLHPKIEYTNIQPRILCKDQYKELLSCDNGDDGLWNLVQDVAIMYDNGGLNFLDE